MLTIGLTGGIGSGKSSVAEMFKDEGAYVIDFDYLARVVVEPDSPAWKDIVDYFGQEILSSDKTLNRSKLAEIVFSDAQSRMVLEGFTHPRIFEKSDTLLKDIKKKDPKAIIIVDIPLLFELSLKQKFDKVILVYISRDLQIERAIQRGVLTKEEIEKRLNAQINIEKKKLLSDYIINNEGSLRNTRDQVRKVTHELKKLVSIQPPRPKELPDGQRSGKINID
ncbi:MAG: dephospho-CoA kinase [Deltaproteobacteria bacterium]|nr:dephospho-CoA kinase [Deltaproteobacteria bacterium]OQY17227.1 MAG: dephospho-CoA kinase [Desulfobacterium sp. 4572_20]HDH87996.1 dephospho-CoA kinase [Desulfobacteraceae bacterium]MBW2105559.1 dephospho-CoA kinase [Deltaproteobacteria bacterium]MBW2333055.1 dephospho-CoA kinase [Deltaproteobacteria bacterium]